MNQIKKLRGSIAVIVAWAAFSAFYAVPTMISAPNTMLNLLAVANVIFILWWGYNFGSKWYDEANVLRARKAAESLTRTTPPTSNN